jgi:putative ABC transport system permease protein
MLKSFLLVTLRRITANKGGAYLNLLCLTLGMAATLYIYNHISYELSFDQHLSNVHRVESMDNTTGLKNALTDLETAKQAGLQAEIKNVSALVKYSENNGALFIQQVPTKSQQKVHVESIFISDTSIFSMLGIEVLIADNEFIDKPSLFISRSIAEELTKDSDLSITTLLGTDLTTPGKSIIKETFTIKGVFEDLTPNTHIHINALVLFSESIANMMNQDAYTYVQGNSLPAEIKLGMGQYNLRRVSEIHRSTGVSNNPEASVNLTMLIFLGVIGLIIMLLAITNYVNNSIINSFDRSQEIGIRKLSGNSPLGLIAIFLTEAFFIHLVASCLAILCYQTGLNYLPGLMGISTPGFVHANWEQWQNSLRFIVILCVVSSVASGSYPAMYFNNLKLTDLLKGKRTLIGSKAVAGSTHVVRSLIIFQITVSLLFISGVLIVHKQRKHMEESATRPFGLNVTGVFPGSSGANQQFAVQTHKRLRELIAEDVIRDAVLSNLSNNSIKTVLNIAIPRSATTADSINYDLIVADHAYLKSFQFLWGTNFGPAFGFDHRKMILNKPGFKRLDSSFTGTIETSMGSYEIIGGIDDGRLQPSAYVTGFNYRTYFDLSLYYPGFADQSLEEYLHDVEVALSSPLPFFSLYKRDYEQQKDNETILLKAFFLFSGLAVFIACIGMVGLSSFIATKRAREISLKKLLGAQPGILVWSLVKDCLQLVVVAGVLALPFILLGGNKWLEDYPNQIDISPTVIIGPMASLLLLFLLMVIGKFWNTAQVNPLQAIRDH